MWRFWISDKGAEADSDGLAVWESADDTDFAILLGDCAPRPRQAKCNSLTNNKLRISFEFRTCVSTVHNPALLLLSRNKVTSRLCGSKVSI